MWSKQIIGRVIPRDHPLKLSDIRMCVNNDPGYASSDTLSGDVMHV